MNSTSKGCAALVVVVVESKVKVRRMGATTLRQAGRAKKETRWLDKHIEGGCLDQALEWTTKTSQTREAGLATRRETLEPLSESRRKEGETATPSGLLSPGSIQAFLLAVVFAIQIGFQGRNLPKSELLYQTRRSME